MSDLSFGEQLNQQFVTPCGLFNSTVRSTQILSYKVILLEYTREFLLAGKIGSFNLGGGRPTGTNAVTESSLIN